MTRRLPPCTKCGGTVRADWDSGHGWYALTCFQCGGIAGYAEVNGASIGLAAPLLSTRQWATAEGGHQLARDAETLPQGTYGVYSVPEKVCRRCGVPKPATTDDWGVNRARPDGLQSCCRTCTRARDRARAAHDSENAGHT